ncbi:N-acetyltransferase [Microbacterium sp. CGR2]|nr:N-acetyltransferase [Microbacterium sp. CGR2]
MQWSLRESVQADAEWIAELRAEVMRPDLKRLGRYDPVRVRRRFLDAFVPRNTRIICVDGQDVGSIAVRREADCFWIEHFYLDPPTQGRGVGRQVLMHALDSGGGDMSFRLHVLQGSRARRLYEDQGFTAEDEDSVDVYMIRRPRAPARRRSTGAIS